MMTMQTTATKRPRFFVFIFSSWFPSFLPSVGKRSRVFEDLFDFQDIQYLIAIVNVRLDIQKTRWGLSVAEALESSMRVFVVRISPLTERLT